MHRFAKTLSYGIMHMTVATSIAYLLTQNMAVALGIGMIEPVVQVGFYWLHESIWEKAEANKLASVRIRS